MATSRIYTVRTYTVTGMDCANCAATIEKGVGKLDGVQAAHVDLATSKLRIEGNIEREAVRQRVEALGYGLAAETATTHPIQQPRSGLSGFWVYLLAHTETRLALAGGVLILLGLVGIAIGLPSLLRDGLFIAAMLIAAYPAARNGLRTLIINREFSIDLLMVIAAIGAVLIGDMLEGATVIFLFAIGEALEGYTVDRARDSLRSLMTLAPALATRLTNESEQVIPVGELEVDDLILVKPGERIPMDGRITKGESDVNQAPITGESVPVYKTGGDEVFAGTINGSGLLTVCVTRLAADNTLNRIIHLVEEAQAERAPSQRLIDRFARVYTPAVVVLAALIAVLPPVLFGAPLLDVPGAGHGWLYRALSLLVIACPCALVIGTPVTILSGITAAARRGVLIKGGTYLEALGQVQAFVFDKTGTLTRGQPIVMTARAATCVTGEVCEQCDDVLALASAVERRSTHPLAKAVLEAAQQRGLDTRYAPAEAVENMAGRGIRGMIDGHLVTVGSHALFDAEHPHSAEFHALVNSAEAQGQTTLLLCDGEQVRGYVAVADAVREDSRAVIGELKDLGGTTVMLTGDNLAVAHTVGDALGISDVRAGLLPADKLSAIRELLAEHKSVAMIGDGVNDTPALAAATVGIAMGGAGSDQALETADVALMADDLRQLPFAVRLARFTRRLIWQNIAFSLGTKLLFLGLALVGGASLWLAILADVGVSLLVTLNGTRPMRFETVHTKD